MLRALARAGMQRGDTLLALGGGVVGDLAGFCAATYQRGVPVVQVPTTVVAQVDSAYGGKTGVDLPEAKNYVGAFHQPAAVITDPAVLATLPAEELRAGYAEVVKTALIAGGGLWERVLALAPLERAVADDLAGACRPWSRTARARSSPSWRRTSATRACGRRSTSGTRSRTRSSRPPATGRSGTARRSPSACWRRCGCPSASSGLDPGVRERGARPARRERPAHHLRRARPPTSCSAHMGRDKKRSGARRNLVLLRAPGDVAIGAEAPEEVLVDAIEELRA